MINYVIKKIIGSKNDREVKKLRPLVAKINEFEQQFQALSDEQLRAKTVEWKAHIEAERQKRGYAALMKHADELEAELNSEAAKIERRKAHDLEQEILNELLPEAFAAVKNACRRMFDRQQVVNVRGHELAWDMIPFDVQLIGGTSLHKGKISEMATGEGKTLVATLPIYLNALTGHGVHLVTVNDYLAARDSEWMGAVYKFLGLTVGCILHDQSPAVRREQYNCDITYGTNAEFGFDYLRDNGMAARAEEQVQRGHFYAIVDEVDSILIDEARTPLIISGPAVMGQDSGEYMKYKPQVEALVRNQERLCNRYLSEAEEHLKKFHATDGEPANPEGLGREIGLLLYKVKMGQPRSEGLMKILEEPANLKLMNQAELSLHADQSKKDLYAQKEELFFAMDEKAHDADLTEKGRNALSPGDPDAFMLPDLITAFHEIDTGPEKDVQKRLELKNKMQKDYEAKAQRIHCISQLLKAYCLYLKDVQYVIQDNHVIIVDENTGRLMTGRRWSDGLHQAVEAKENAIVEEETQTYATITIQNYFRLYAKLAGMTGTAETEAQEFLDIYKLGVLVIPTNKPCVRKDRNDSVYKTKREKFAAVVREIQEIHAQGRPILVGTVSVETSEQLSKMLKKVGIVHSVLNAKFHAQEAEIVARAGQSAAVTIATNMAGRGTDIKLGPGIAERGGLHVLATERHEARRIDRQLRGRCARQGDPGSSHFFIALEDDLMRLFGSDKIVKYMEKMGLEEGQELEHPLLNKSIEQAQKRVEGHNFQIRKRTLEYDDVMNKQREVVYGFRNQIIHGADVRDRLMDVMEEVVISKIDEMTDPEKTHDTWNVRGLADWVNINFPIGVTEEQIVQIADKGSELPVAGSAFDGMSAAQFALCQHIIEGVRKAYELKVSCEDQTALLSIERYTVLSAIDRIWQEHLYNMDSLRNAIGLRAYGQRDPLIEYKVEAKKLFDDMMVNIKSEICHNIFRSASSMMAFENFLRTLQRQAHEQSGGGAPSAYATTGSSSSSGGGEGGGGKASDMVTEATEALSKPAPIRTGPKVGRNDPCPCGSGKKFKQCCGKA
ncbi:MAG: preprotein translocase subunit SecA [Verrucomicrobia bacterium]|nr:preprotein translocase subunit SecA [Verrucomicrobiota bacterium]